MHITRRIQAWIKKGLPLLSVLGVAGFLLATEPGGYALFLLAAAALHECGHTVAFLLCGERLPVFRGRSFGFLLTPETGYLSYGKEAFVAFAGPAFNILAAAALIPALRAGEAREANFCFFALNLLTAAFNLLPIRGFDGWRVMSAMMYLLFSEKTARFWTDALSTFVCLFFYFCALFLTFCAGAGVYPLLLSLFLLWGERRHYPMLFEHSGAFARKPEHSGGKAKIPPSHAV